MKQGSESTRPPASPPIPNKPALPPRKNTQLNQLSGEAVSSTSPPSQRSSAVSPRRPSIPSPRTSAPEAVSIMSAQSVKEAGGHANDEARSKYNMSPSQSPPAERSSGLSPRRPSISQPRTPAPLPPSISIPDKIRLLCKKQSGDESLQDDFGLYIPPCGTRTQFSSTTFDLTAEVNDFIESNKIVMLISGESGSGKSFFCQSYIKSKCERYQTGDRIPLFCSLPTIRKLKSGLMVEVLSQHGFTVREVNTLRESEKFLVVFDAYDETNSELNLFLENELDKWDIRAIFTCRPSYFGQDKNYSRLFIPFKMQRPLNDAFQEVFVSPFVVGQIDQYIKQFLNVRGDELRNEIRARDDLTEDWLKPAIYKTWIGRIPGLEDLTRNPFLLRIMMEVLRGIVAEFESLGCNEDKFRMTSVKLYDSFVDKWFARQEVKLMGRGENVGKTFQTDCKKFAKALAKKMQEKNKTVVYYQDVRSDDDPFGEVEIQDEANLREMKEFAIFFSDELLPQDQGSKEKLENRKRWRLANLIKKVGDCQWTFIHPSIRDYFVTLNIIGPQLRANNVSAMPITAVVVQQGREHRTVSRFRLMNRFNFQEAQELQKNEGIKIVFDPGEQNQKVVLGQGHFGKFRIAQQIVNHRFAGVKKIRGEQLIKESEKEAIFQKELNGLPNVMPLWDSQLIKSKKTGESILLQFMPLAGFGSGEKLIPLLQFIDNQELKNKFLIHILRSLVIGLKGLHSRKVRHLDMKPANFVLDCRGEVYVIDFGCAYREYSNKSDAVIRGGNGDSHYFSPERLAYYRKKMLKKLPPIDDPELVDEFDAEKVDIWAVGLAILEIYLENLEYIRGVDQSLNWKLETWNSQFFNSYFNGIVGWETATNNSLLGLLKKLLMTNPAQRPSAVSVLKHPVLNDPNLMITPDELKHLMADLIKWKTEPPRAAGNDSSVSVALAYDHMYPPKYSGVADLLVDVNHYGNYGGIMSDTEVSDEDADQDVKTLKK